MKNRCKENPCCGDPYSCTLGTRPAAPVEGLETVGYAEQFSNGKIEVVSVNEGKHCNVPLVTRSQAEAIIAAERAGKEELKKALTDREWISNKHNEHRAKLKADNAAHDARVKALETQLAVARKALEETKAVAWQRESLPLESANKDAQRGTAIALSGRLGEIISMTRAALEASHGE